MMKEVFRGTPYGGSVIGDEKDVRNLSREQMMEFFKTFYVPNNAIVVVVGDVKASRVHRLVKEKYGKLEKSLTLDAQKKEIEGTNSYKIKPRRKKKFGLMEQHRTPFLWFLIRESLSEQEKLL